MTRAWIPPAVTLAVRAALALSLDARPRWDGFFYARYAEALAHGRGYVETLHPPDRPTAFYPVGYPAALSAALRLLGDPQRAVVGLNLAAALVGCLVVMHLGTTLADRPTGWRAGMLYALLPGPALWSLAAMTETLTGTLLALAAALLLRSHHAQGSRPLRGLPAALGAGVTLGLAGLVRPPSLALLVAPWALPLAWTRRLVLAATLCLGAALAVGPWTARNCARLDACALISTNGGSNLLIGTFPEARGGYRRPRPDDGCDRVDGEVHRDRCMARVARGRIVRDPWTWLRSGLWKLAITFGWEHDPVSYLWPWPPRGLPPVGVIGAVMACTLSWWALVVLALRGALVARGSAAVRVIAVAAFGVVATHGVFLGADRYHLVLVALLCPLATRGMHRRDASAELRPPTPGP